MDVRIEIYGLSGDVIGFALITEEAICHEELMTSDYVQLSWSDNKITCLPAGSYIIYNNERYSLLEPYNPLRENEAEYRYTPQFHSRIMKWDKIPVPLYTYESDGTTVKGREMDWEFTGSPADAMYMVMQAIRNETGENWTIQLSDSIPATITISSQSNSIFSLLTSIANECKTEWWADKSTNVLYLSQCKKGTELTLKVGDNVGVPTVTQSKDGYYTRFYVFGSTRNITKDYQGGQATNHIVNKRLTLDPIKYPGGYKDTKGHFDNGVFVSDLQKGEVFIKTLYFDDVYPKSKLTISDVRARLKYRLDTNGNKVRIGGTDEEPVYEQYAIWYFQISGLNFDPSTIIEEKELAVSFESGQLAGRDFKLTYHEKASVVNDSADFTPFNVKAGDFEINIDESTGNIIPGMAYIIPQNGDDVILYNIEMPDEYVASAQEELELELDKKMESYTCDNNSYEFDSYPVSFYDDGTDLNIGQSVAYVNGDKILHTRVIMVEKRLDFSFQQRIRIGNEIIKGNTQQLKEEVANVNQNIDVIKAFNELSISLSNAYANAQREMIEGFAAIKDIWEFDNDESHWTTDDSGNKIKTIKSKFNVWSNGYVSALGASGSSLGGSFDLLQEWDKYVDETAKSMALSAYLGKDLLDRVTSLEKGQKGHKITISGSGNVLVNVAESSDGSTLTFTKGNIDLSGYATTTALAEVSKKTDAVTTKVNDFLEGTDTDGIINKWKELEAFLNGQTQTSTLAELLAVKADKSIRVNAGTGLAGGGSLSTNITLSLATVGTAGTYTKVTVDKYGRVTGHSSLAAADIPTLEISKINGLQAELDKKLNKTDFGASFATEMAKWFAKDPDGNIYVANEKGFYSNSFISALGLSDNEGGSGVVSYDRLDNWSDYSSGKAAWVLSAKLGYELNERLKSIEAGGATSVVTSGSGNVVTAVTKSGTVITATKGITALTSHQAIYALTLQGNGSTIGTYNPKSANATINITPANIGAATSGHKHTISILTDLGEGWDVLLKEAPSEYVTRWPAFSEITDTPSTLAGYGITDGVNGVTVTGNGNAVTAASVSGHTLTLTKGSTFLLSSAYTAADVLAKLKTVDGSGSGLDADMLDGVHLDGLFTGLSWSTQTLSITIGGVSKTAKIPYATSSVAGLVSTGTQTFGGLKTFNSGLVVPAGKSLKIGNGTITWDSDKGCFHFSHGLYSDDFVSALGISDSTGGGGTSYDRLDAWGDYTSEKASWVLSAKLGYDLNTRVSALEGGSAMNFEKSGTGNALTGFSKSGNTVTFTTGTFLTSHQKLYTLTLQRNGEGIGSYVPTADKVININACTAITMPKGFTVGTLSSVGVIGVTFASGYSLPTTAKQQQWDTAYSFVSSIMGSDADGVIDKWNEIISFLDGIGDSSTLEGLLNDINGNVTAVGNRVTTLEGYFTNGIAKQAAKTTGTLSINGKSFNGSANITVGTMGVAYGGTGKSSVASGSMLYASAANVYSELATTSFGRNLLKANSGVVVTGLNADTLDGVHLGGIFTDIRWSTQKLSLTIGGVTNSVTIPYATTSVPGLVSTVAQTFAGAKTFNAGLIVPSGQSIKIGGGTITWDSAKGCFHISHGLYSDSFISALGVSDSTGGGGGSSLDRLDDWDDYTTDRATWVLSAKLGADLNTRLKSVEAGSATSVVMAGSGNAVTSITKSGTVITATKGSTFLLSSAYTAADILSKLKTVDGSGSGLDADLLDGTHKSGLLTALSSSSATNLSLTVGGTTKTIADLYATQAANADMLDNVHLNGIFTGFSANGNSTRLVIGGVTKDLTVPYATSAGKWATTRSVTLGCFADCSFSINGSANVNFDFVPYNFRLSVGNRNNYPWHRIAKIGTISSTYYDAELTLLLSQGYDGGYVGIVRITLRTNNTGAASSAKAEWLLRKGFASDSVKVGIYNVFGSTYADVFLHSNGAYAATTGVVLTQGARGSLSRKWTLVDSSEVNDTTASDKLTSYECWASIESAATDLHGKAYSQQVTAVDSATVKTANQLTTSRTINGTSFNGTANITTSYWGTARNIYIQDATAANTGAAVSVNGSANVNLKLPSTITATLSGNASSATKLATARTINGTNFDGTANITTVKWGTARNIYIRDASQAHTGAAVSVDGSATEYLLLPSTITATLVGNADTATELQTPRTINGTYFSGVSNITTSYWGVSRNIYIQDATEAHTGAAVSVNGSANVNLKLPSTITATLVGNASSATKLATARTLWGRSFDGTANVSGSLSGVGTITGSGTLTLVGNDDIYLKRGGVDSNSLVLSGNVFKPFNSANNNIDLGSSSAKWRNLYVAGTANVGSITIGSGKITWDSAKGCFHFSHGLYSDSFVSALGANSSASGGGGSYERLDSWSDYSSDKATWVLSAKLGNELNSRVSALEAGGATSVVTSGSGNVVTAVTKSGTVITATKGITALTSHQAIYALTLQGNGSTIGTYNPKSANATINLTAKNLLLGRGLQNPQTGRTQNFGRLYSYYTSGSAHENAPTTYTAVIGFGSDNKASVEIAGGWTSGMGLWYRALRDVEDDWFGWRKVLDESNYASVLDSRYYTESEINTKLTNGSVTKVGTASVGGTVKPIYLNGGVPTALSANAGNSTHPVYLNAGAITQCGSTLDVSVSGGAAYLCSSRRMDYGWNGLNYFNADLDAGCAAKVNDSPTSAWWHILRFNHANSSGYYTDLAIPFNSDSIYWKTVRNGKLGHSAWARVLDSLNYTSYTVTKTGGGASGTWGIGISGNAATSTYTGLTWTSNTKVGSYSKLCRISDYANVLLSVNLSQNSQASNHLFLISTGYGQANIIQLGANNYSGNSSVKMRVTSADATHFDVEILNSFGYNNAEYLSVGCKAIKCDNECSITTYTSYTAGSGTVEKEITSSYNSIVANLTGNASTASKWQTARTLSLTGAVTGSASIDGSGNVSINTTYATGNISSLDSRYVNVSGDTMTGNLIFSKGKQIRWTSHGTSYITDGDVDNGSNLGGELANLVISSWYGVSFTTSCSGQTYTGKTAVGINCRNGFVYAAKFIGTLQGNADTASKLTTTSAGSSTRPVYFSNGIPVGGAYSFGNGNGNASVNNGTVCTNLNADMLDGVHLLQKGSRSGVLRSWSRGSFTTVNQYFGNGAVVVIDPAPTDSSELWANTSIFSIGDVEHRNWQMAFGFNSDTIKVRRIWDGPTYGNWKQLAFIDSNVASATKLATSRNINGTSFNGTANIVTSYWGTARTIYIQDASGAHGSVGVSVNGSTNYNLKLPSTITATLVGNASTATKLQTARTLWGRSFDGSANVSGDMTGVGNVTPSANGTLNLGTATSRWANIYTNSIDVYGSIPIIRFHYNNASTATDFIGASSNGLITISNVLRIYQSSGVYVDKGEFHVAGKVVIGSTPSTYVLNVQGEIGVTGTYGGMRIIPGYVSGEAFRIDPITSSGASNSNRITLLQNGNVCIGGPTATSYKLDVSGSIYARANIIAAGAVTALVVSSSSDARLKNIIRDACPAVEDVADAPAVEFAWKKDGSRAVGSIAQYWQGVLPQAVHEERGYLAMQYDVIAMLASIANARRILSIEKKIRELEAEVKRLKTA